MVVEVAVTVVYLKRELLCPASPLAPGVLVVLLVLHQLGFWGAGEGEGVARG